MSDEPGGRVVIIDPVTGRVVGSLAVGKRPRGIRVLGDGQHLLVALSGSPVAGPGVDESKLPPGDRKADGIGLVDLRALKVSRVLRSGTDPEAFALSPDEKILYVSNEASQNGHSVNVGRPLMLPIVQPNHWRRLTRSNAVGTVPARVAGGADEQSDDDRLADGLGGCRDRRRHRGF